jgi:7-carboxy-7-deazaguanine synthase
MKAQANLIEIFSSYQGEGPYVGRPMTFLRFQDCALSCSYCDTPASFEKHAQFRVEAPPRSESFELYSNPVDGPSLTRLLDSFQDSFLSLTGGEPLQHADFLASWLPELPKRSRILLETNGVLPAALAKVLPWVDVVSMDFKLPSVTGMRAYWKEHREFLRLARGKEVYVKLVVSQPTDLEELREAVALVETEAPEAPFILQPVTPYGPVREEILQDRLREIFELSKRRLKDVRVIPQVHPRLGIL